LVTTSAQRMGVQMSVSRMSFCWMVGAAFRVTIHNASLPVLPTRLTCSGQR